MTKRSELAGSRQRACCRACSVLLGASRGSALVAVMAIVTAVLLVGVAIFVLGYSESDIVEYAVDDARAFYIAEGGLERVRSWLGELEQNDPGADPVGTTFEGQPLGGGLYTAEVISSVSGGGWPEAYEVISTGEIDGVVRQVKGTIVAATFAQYQWFLERGGWKWFHTNERFEGPVHVNRQLQIDGDPWFGGRVTAGGGYTEKQGSNPTFIQGYELNVDDIPLPDLDYVYSTLRAAAQGPGGLYEGPLGNKTYYSVELGQPSPGFLTYGGYKDDGTQIGLSTVVDISTLNGAVWFGETVQVSGVLDGQITLGAEGNIEIMGDLLYLDSTPGSGPNPGCDDVLGMVAAGHPEGDVIIRYTPDNASDCEVHGVMMALEKNLEAEDHQTHPPRGDFIVYGGIIVDQSIHLAQYTNDVLFSGYVRDYHYDPRLLTMPPPFFPLTGDYFVLSWEEVVPPQLS